MTKRDSRLDLPGAETPLSAEPQRKRQRGSGNPDENLKEMRRDEPRLD
jgi:hypothetical protein